MTAQATTFGKRLRRRLILASVLSVGLPGVWMIIGPAVSELLRNPEDDWYDIRVVGSATMVVAVGVLIGLVILSIALFSTSPNLSLRCWWPARVAPFAVAWVIGSVVAPSQPPFFTGLAVVAAFFASGVTAALALETREHWHARSRRLPANGASSSNFVADDHERDAAEQHLREQGAKRRGGEGRDSV